MDNSFKKLYKETKTSDARMLCQG